MNTRELLRSIFDDIGDPFSDVSVPAQVTKEALTEIREEVDLRLECLDGDRKRQQGLGEVRGDDE